MSKSDSDHRSRASESPAHEALGIPVVDLQLVQGEQGEHGKVNWRDSLMTWPSLRISFEALPWNWRVGYWHDWPLSASGVVEVGPVSVHLSSDRHPFTLERSA